MSDIFYIDKEMLEHGCCWTSAVVRKCAKGQGMYGGEVDLICECRDDMAQAICDALNARLEQQ